MEHVDVKVEPRSTFTFTRTLLYIAFNSFTHVNITCVRTETLHDSGNPPQGKKTEIKLNLRC